MLKSINDTYNMLDSNEIPCVAFGTYKTGEGESNIHTLAIEEGYRFFDTASLYETERSLGAGIKESGIEREKLFIQSKLWHDERGYDNAKEALKRSLKRLDLEYLDMYLIHWPKTSKDEEGWEETNLETWRAMEECKKEGLIKGMGVSNFLPHHLDSLIKGSGIKPLVDQLELHIGYDQKYAVNYCRENGIIPESWSPIGRGDLVNNPVIIDFAKKYNKSIPQICLRYLIQKNIIPIVKSSSAEHMRQNMDVFDFEISFEDMSLLECFPYSTWKGEHPDWEIPKKSSNPNQ